MIKAVIFLVLSIPLIYISRRCLFNLKNHGFYRLISWECILWLLVSNLPFWFRNWYGIPQIISWILLFLSIPILVLGVAEMKRTGKQDQNRDNSLYNFEKTSSLVESGIFAYIRHPLYSSLLFLTWGIFFKHIDLVLLNVSLISSIALYLTAKMEEKENIVYFGENYKEYIFKTKMFVPFVF